MLEAKEARTAPSMAASMVELERECSTYAPGMVPTS